MRVADDDLVDLWVLLWLGWGVGAVSSPLVVVHGVVLGLGLASAVVDWGGVGSEAIVLGWAGGVAVSVSKAGASVLLVAEAGVSIEDLGAHALIGLLLAEAGEDITIPFARFFWLNDWVTLIRRGDRVRVRAGISVVVSACAI